MRHGQTEWNVQHLLQGANRDIDLTDEGVRLVELKGGLFSLKARDVDLTGEEMP